MPEHAKMSGLMVKLKPTGKAHLILNLNAPKYARCNFENLSDVSLKHFTQALLKRIISKGYYDILA